MSKRLCSQVSLIVVLALLGIATKLQAQATPAGSKGPVTSDGVDEAGGPNPLVNRRADRTPPNIIGMWRGDDWGDIELQFRLVVTDPNGPYYSGTYTDTFSTQPGKIELSWSPDTQRFEGTWKEGDDRAGNLAIRMLPGGNVIRGSWTTNAKSKVQPGRPEHSDLEWLRSNKTPLSQRTASNDQESKPNPETHQQMKIFRLAHGRASDYATILAPIFPRVKLVADPRTNSIVAVSDAEEPLMVLEALLLKLDEDDSPAPPRTTGSQASAGPMSGPDVLKTVVEVNEVKAQMLAEQIRQQATKLGDNHPDLIKLKEIFEAHVKDLLEAKLQLKQSQIDFTLKSSPDHLKTAVDEYDAKARMLADQFREQSTKLGDKHPELVKLKQDLESTLKAGLEAKFQLEQSQIGQLEERLSRLRTQMQVRKAASQKIIDRRVRELLEPDPLRWNSDGAAATPSDQTESREPQKKATIVNMDVHAPAGYSNTKLMHSLNAIPGLLTNVRMRAASGNAVDAIVYVPVGNQPKLTSEMRNQIETALRYAGVATIQWEEGPSLKFGDSSLAPAAGSEKKVIVDLYAPSGIWKNQAHLGKLVQPLNEIPNVVTNLQAVPGPGDTVIMAIVRDPAGLCRTEMLRTQQDSVLKNQINSILAAAGITAVRWEDAGSNSKPAGDATSSARTQADHTQVHFLEPAGLQILIEQDRTPLTLPARFNFPRDAKETKRYSIWIFPKTESQRPKVLAILDICPADKRVAAFLTHNSVPLKLTNEDLEQFLAGNPVVKAVYLPDPKFQELAIPKLETIVSTRLEPNADVVVEAERRGSVVAVIRFISHVDAVTSDATEVDAKSSRVWSQLGLKLTPVANPKLLPQQFRGGLLVTDVDRSRPIAVQAGDVLLGIHKWETQTLDHVLFVTKQPDIRALKSISLFVARYGKIVICPYPTDELKLTRVVEPEDPVEENKAPALRHDLPTAEEVMQILPKEPPSRVPSIADVQYHNVKIVVEPLVDRLDEERVYPLVGSARLHRRHYKCTVTYDKVIQSDWPIPYHHKDETTQVAYLDRDTLIHRQR